MIITLSQDPYPVISRMAEVVIRSIVPSTHHHMFITHSQSVTNLNLPPQLFRSGSSKDVLKTPNMANPAASAKNKSKKFSLNRTTVNPKPLAQSTLNVPTTPTNSGIFKNFFFDFFITFFLSFTESN